MLVRSTALAALAAATALAAGGSTATVVLSASDQGVTASSEHSDNAKAGDAHGKSAAAPAGNQAGETTTVEAPPCPADVKNHGAYVSSVAKNKAEDAEPGEHGALVSAAAQSDCGKPEGGEGAEGADAAEGATGSAKGDEASEAGKDNASEQGKTGQELGQNRGRSAEHVPARS